MKDISRARVTLIDITNACVNECANCTRFVGHHRQPYFMDLSLIEKCLDSLELSSPNGCPSDVGIIGGEPTLHPKFREICDLLLTKASPDRFVLFTSGYKWEEYKQIIRRTFKGGVYYNDHSGPRQSHQPMLIAIDEAVSGDQAVTRCLIDQCWVQERWSPTMNPKGAFFCEIAAAQDLLFGGPGGYPIVPGWWRRRVADFQDQVMRYCQNCGGALPLPRLSAGQDYDDVSPKILAKLQAVQSPRAAAGKVKIFDRRLTAAEIKAYSKNWRPWKYLGRGGKRKSDLKLDELFLLWGFNGLRRGYNILKYRLPTYLKGKIVRIKSHQTKNR